MHSATAELVEPQRLLKCGRNFIARKRTRRKIPGVNRSHQEQAIFFISQRKSGDFVFLGIECPLLPKRDRIFQRSFIAELIQNNTGELFFVMRTSNSGLDGCNHLRFQLACERSHRIGIYDLLSAVGHRALPIFRPSSLWQSEIPTRTFLRHSPT